MMKPLVCTLAILTASGALLGCKKTPPDAPPPSPSAAPTPPPSAAPTAPAPPAPAAPSAPPAVQDGPLVVAGDESFVRMIEALTPRVLGALPSTDAPQLVPYIRHGVAERSLVIRFVPRRGHRNMAHFNVALLRNGKLRYTTIGAINERLPPHLAGIPVLPHAEEGSATDLLAAMTRARTAVNDAACAFPTIADAECLSRFQHGAAARVATACPEVRTALESGVVPSSQVQFAVTYCTPTPDAQCASVTADATWQQGGWLIQNVHFNGG